MGNIDYFNEKELLAAMYSPEFKSCLKHTIIRLKTRRMIEETTVNEIQDYFHVDNIRKLNIAKIISSSKYERCLRQTIEVIELNLESTSVQDKELYDIMFLVYFLKRCDKSKEELTLECKKRKYNTAEDLWSDPRVVRGTHEVVKERYQSGPSGETKLAYKIEHIQPDM